VPLTKSGSYPVVKPIFAPTSPLTVVIPKFTIGPSSEKMP
jgi:hypothetical protein